jgi:hypothetical protein
MLCPFLESFKATGDRLAATERQFASRRPTRKAVPRLERLEDRAMPAQLLWAGPDWGFWHDPANWVDPMTELPAGGARHGPWPRGPAPGGRARPAGRGRELIWGQRLTVVTPIVCNEVARRVTSPGVSKRVPVERRKRELVRLLQKWPQHAVVTAPRGRERVHVQAEPTSVWRTEARNATDHHPMSSARSPGRGAPRCRARPRRCTIPLCSTAAALGTEGPIVDPQL